MNFKCSNKKFVSETDHYLKDFNHSHAKTPSQLAEIAKHQKVFLKRDVEQQPTDNTIWEDF